MILRVGLYFGKYGKHAFKQEGGDRNSVLSSVAEWKLPARWTFGTFHSMSTRVFSSSRATPTMQPTSNCRYLLPKIKHLSTHTSQAEMRVFVDVCSQL